MLKHFKIIGLSAALFCNSLWAANLNITILEKGSGDPVEAASVVLINNGENDITDESGTVMFEAVDLPDQLKVLGLGYEVLIKEVDKDQPLTLYITPISAETEALVVQEDRILQKTSKIVLTVEELARAPGTGGDPLKVIESLPGVVVNSSDAGGGLYIRGSDSTGNLAWVDRVPIGYLYHMGGIYSTISPHMIQDFNIFLGGFPVEYNDKLGGVLDVKLRSPRRDRLHHKYSIGTYQSSIFLEGPIGEAGSNQGFFLSARRSYLDMIFSPEAFTNFMQGDDDSPEDQQNKVVQVPVFSDLQAVWEYNTDIGTFSTHYFKARDEAKFIINENRLTDPESAGVTGFYASFSSLSFNWEQNWGGGLSHTMPLTFYNTENSFQIGSDENGKPFFLDIKDQQLFYQPELSQTFKSGDRLRTGVMMARATTPVKAKITREPSESDIGNFTLSGQEKFIIDETYKGYAIAPYADYLHYWSPRFNTTAGLRYVIQEIEGGNRINGLQPRLQAEYQLSPNTYLTAAWGLYLQAPRGSEVVKEAGNPNLDYTEAEHRIIGLKHQLSPQWNLLVEAFHKPMSKLVTNISENAPPNNYSNEGRGKAYGIDLLLKREFSHRRSGWLSYSYIKATRTGRNGITRPFSGDQPHTLSLVWSQPMPGSWQKWDVGFRFRYNSGQPYDPVIGTALSDDGSYTVAVYPNKKNAARLPNFYQLDVRFDRPVLYNTWKLNFYIDILNILNTQNVTGYDYGNNLERVNNPDEQYSLPLFPTFGIEAEF